MNKVTYLVAIVALLVLAFLLYRDARREEQMDMLLLKMQQQPRIDARGRPLPDPYLENQVKNRIIKGYGELQSCYKEYLKGSPAITDGEVKIDWQIYSSGKTNRPEVVLSAFSSDALHKCMTETIARWEFPQPATDKYIVHTFRFNKKE